MKIKTNLAMTSLAVMLAACGGGGSGEVANIDPTPIIQPVDLQTQVPNPTYEATSPNLESFIAINKFRASLGLGLWAQNAKLDQAAKNHIDYSNHHRKFGHGESKDLPGFTGEDATARGKYVGYEARWIGEVGTPSIGEAGVANLIDTVYHRSALMNQWVTEMGIANSADPNFGVQFISFSDANKRQRNAPDFTAVYPLPDQKDVPLFMMSENINPFPTIDRPSAPISFMSERLTKLTVSKFTVRVHGSQTPLATQMITNDNDPHPMALPPYEAYLVGEVPFLPNTQYDVSFEGAVNQVPVKKEWSFTTRAK